MNVKPNVCPLVIPPLGVSKEGKPEAFIVGHEVLSGEFVAEQDVTV